MEMSINKEALKGLYSNIFKIIEYVNSRKSIFTYM